LIQTYCISIWAKPHESDIDEMADICYQVLSSLMEYSAELSPKYLPAMKKSNVKEFEFNRENIVNLLNKNVNKSGKLVFLDLGRRIRFFSSLDDELSCGISLCVGTSNPKFINSLVIDLPYGNFSGFNDRIIEFENLFKKLISIFNPYFGFISNSLNKQLSKTFWEDGKPTCVHWMNYYDKDTAEIIGIEKLTKMDNCEPLGNGYFLKLLDTPLNVENNEHLSIQHLTSAKLGLLEK